MIVSGGTNILKEKIRIDAASFKTFWEYVLKLVGMISINASIIIMIEFRILVFD
jgi:hypothetical protein